MDATRIDRPPGGDDTPLPERIGPYRIEALVGNGGMGIVYRARDVTLNRRVAIKVLRPEIVGRGQALERFHQEALAIARLRHPNLVQVYTYGVDEVDSAFGGPDSRHYFAMDFLEGRSLDVVIETEPPPLEEKLALIAALSQALAYAHSMGVIHRDIKPSNVIVVPSGRPILTDFGVAKALDRVSDLTQEGSSIGTPYYMAPEQLEGRFKEVDARSDVYSLGVLFFELLTGKKPFRAKTKGELYYKVLSAELDFPPRSVAELPEAVRAICKKAMHRDPAGRYQSMAALLSDLEAYRAGLPVAAMASVAGRPRPGRWIATLAGLCLVCVLALAVSLAGMRREDDRGDPTGADPGRDPGRDDGSEPPADAPVKSDPRRALAALRDAVRGGDPGPIAAALEALRAAGAIDRDLDEARRLLGDADLAGRLLDGGSGEVAGDLVALFGSSHPRLLELEAAWLTQGKDLAGRDRLVEAERFLDRVLALAPDHFTARRLRADCRVRRGVHVEAAADYERLAGTLIEREVLLDLGRCYAALDRIDDALGALGRYVEAFPEDPEARRLRGTLRFRKNDFAGAIEDLNRSIQETPPVETLRMLGLAYFRVGGFREALLCEAKAGEVGGESGLVESARNRTAMTNALLGRLVFDPRPAYRIDFAVVPPEGNLKAEVDAAWLAARDPARWANGSEFHLAFALRGGSSLRVWFDLENADRPVRLRLEHTSAGTAEGADGRVTLTVNDSVLAEEADIAGGTDRVYERDVTAHCRVGTNVLTLRLAADAKTQYWLRKIAIDQE